MFQFNRWQHITVFTLFGILVLGGIFVFSRIGGPNETTQQPIPIAASAQEPVQCLEPRPQICTQEYIPVCANLKDGTRRTYATGCVACSDVNVVSYTPNQCE